MYKIEKTNYGFKLTFSETVSLNEINKWYQDCETILLNPPNEFKVMIDMVNILPLTNDTQEIMQKGQELFKKKGMIRSVVLVNKVVIAMQFKRIASESGIRSSERYLATENPNAMTMAMDWLVKGIEPSD